MTNKATFRNENGELIIVELLIEFRVEKIGKNYVAYTINDIEETENVNVYISEINYEEEVPRVVPIKEDEAEMVLMFYESLKVNE